MEPAWRQAGKGRGRGRAGGGSGPPQPAVPRPARDSRTPAVGREGGSGRGRGAAYAAVTTSGAVQESHLNESKNCFIAKSICCSFM